MSNGGFEVVRDPSEVYDPQLGYVFPAKQQRLILFGGEEKPTSVLMYEPDELTLPESLFVSTPSSSMLFRRDTVAPSEEPYVSFFMASYERARDEYGFAVFDNTERLIPTTDPRYDPGSPFD